ncbi:MULTISPECIES: hypothetical protein [Candidatus Cardinium]|uniref:hypothetical protein n=1 Tax=Candidatus Cardinium TaxID=273135 RepID=UPI001FAA6C93|nr:MULTISPECIES: hypothetical protein [Cardinium]
MKITKIYARSKASLLVGLLSLHTLSSCVNTRQALGMGDKIEMQITAPLVGHNGGQSSEQNASNASNNDTRTLLDKHQSGECDGKPDCPYCYSASESIWDQTESIRKWIFWTCILGGSITPFAYWMINELLPKESYPTTLSNSTFTMGGGNVTETTPPGLIGASTVNTIDLPINELALWLSNGAPAVKAFTAASNMLATTAINTFFKGAGNMLAKATRNTFFSIFPNLASNNETSTISNKVEPKDGATTQGYPNESIQKKGKKFAEKGLIVKNTDDGKTKLPVPNQPDSNGQSSLLDYIKGFNVKGRNEIKVIDEALLSHIDALTSSLIKVNVIKHMLRKNIISKDAKDKNGTSILCYLQYYYKASFNGVNHLKATEKHPIVINKLDEYYKTFNEANANQRSGKAFYKKQKRPL